MNYLENRTGESDTLVHDSHLPSGAMASNAIQPDYELTIPDVCGMFGLQRHTIEGWIVTGMIRFRMDGDMVYFLEPEIREDVKLAKMHDSFKTGPERTAFMLGAKRTDKATSPNMHYVFKGRRNAAWLNEIKNIGKTQ